MAKRQSRKTTAYTRLQLASQPFIGRLGALCAFGLVLSVLVLGQAGNPHVQALKARTTHAILPLLSAVSAPFDAVKNINHSLADWATAYSQNATLRQENAELLQWQQRAKAMQAENASLRELLNVAQTQNMRFITAQIVSAPSSAFTHSALLNAGVAAGIQKNQAVINQRGLVGRVVETTEHSARVLLLSDMNSRIPVMNERTREKMILAGNNAANPLLTYIPTNSITQSGDRIITSGDGGVFPKGIAVGVVGDVVGNQMSVQLYVDAAQAEYVSVIE